MYLLNVESFRKAWVLFGCINCRSRGALNCAGGLKFPTYIWPWNLWEIPHILFSDTVVDSIPSKPREQGGEPGRTRQRSDFCQQRSTNTLSVFALKQLHVWTQIMVSPDCPELFIKPQTREKGGKKKIVVIPCRPDEEQCQISHLNLLHPTGRGLRWVSSCFLPDLEENLAICHFIWPQIISDLFLPWSWPMALLSLQVLTYTASDVLLLKQG